MTLVFIMWTSLGTYKGFRNVLEIARRRANCPIVVISDRPEQVPGDVQLILMSEFPSGDEIRERLSKHTSQWEAMSVARWFVLREFMNRYQPATPIFCADWDVMVFRDLAKAYAPFADCDYTVSELGDVDSAAYGINRLEPLEAFCELVERVLETGGSRAEGINDMLAWHLVRKTGRWKVGNLFEIREGAVFDHNIHSGDGRFRMDGRTKRVEFRGGYPYFFTLDGTPVAANTIHCWGLYKKRTGRLLRRSRGRRITDPITWFDA